jgi:hypothetical protein
LDVGEAPDPVTRTLALVALLGAFVPSSAPRAGGESEGEGEGPCPTACDGDVLTFCDDGVPAAIDCHDPETIADSIGCGPLGGDFDCLLGSGAACDPDYAGGLSRCGASLSCIDGVCGEGTPPNNTGPLEPSPGSNVGGSDDPASNPFGCRGNGSAPTALFAVVLLALRRRRR